MPQDAPPNGGAQDTAPQREWSRVAGMQAKLHRWAAADPGRRFDDLFVRHEAPVCRAGVEGPGRWAVAAAWRS
jgi:hypothetical protein